MGEVRSRVEGEAGFEVVLPLEVALPLEGEVSLRLAGDASLREQREEQHAGNAAPEMSSTVKPSEAARGGGDGGIGEPGEPGGGE